MFVSKKLSPPVDDKDHMQGASYAPMTLVEFGDYQCPYCGAAYPVVKRLQRYFGKDLRFVFRNFPLIESHEYALGAAMAAEAAALQGKFWEMHDVLYENQERLEGDDLLKYARTLGLNHEQFERDFRSEAVARKVRDDYRNGEVSGVEGTPSFFMNGVKYVDAPEYGPIRFFIERLLRNAATEPKELGF